MSVRLSHIVTMTISELDMVAILSENFCEGSYGAFTNMECNSLSETEPGVFTAVFEGKNVEEPS